VLGFEETANLRFGEEDQLMIVKSKGPMNFDFSTSRNDERGE
jgi:hypothetical protein